MEGADWVRVGVTDAPTAREAVALAEEVWLAVPLDVGVSVGVTVLVRELERDLEGNGVAVELADILELGLAVGASEEPAGMPTSRTR